MIPFYTCSSSLTLSNSFQLLLQTTLTRHTYTHTSKHKEQVRAGERDREREGDLSIERASSRAGASDRGSERARARQRRGERDKEQGRVVAGGPVRPRNPGDSPVFRDELTHRRIPTTRRAIPGTWDRSSSLGLASVCVCAWLLGMWIQPSVEIRGRQVLPGFFGWVGGWVSGEGCVINYFFCDIEDLAKISKKMANLVDFTTSGIRFFSHQKFNFKN